MTKERVGCLVVLDKKEPVGIITERGFADLVKKGNFDCKEVKAQDFMTSPIISVDVNSTYEKAMKIFVSMLIFCFARLGACEALSGYVFSNFDLS